MSPSEDKTKTYLLSVSPLVEVKEEKSFLYAESKRAKLEREKEERRQRMEEDFSPEDLALATVPGYDFDPKERAFQMDELRPQPIIRWRLHIIRDLDTPSAQEEEDGGRA